MNAMNIVNARIKELDRDNQIANAEAWIKEQFGPNGKLASSLGINFAVTISGNRLQASYDYKDAAGNWSKVQGYHHAYFDLTDFDGVLEKLRQVCQLCEYCDV